MKLLKRGDTTGFRILIYLAIATAAILAIFLIVRQITGGVLKFQG